MKVQVDIKMMANPSANSQFEVTMEEGATVANIKERIAALQQIPFPDHQQLKLDEEVLQDGVKLSDCGVKDSSLDLVIEATEATLVWQLSELLQVRDLSCDELGLLYCYKYGVNVSQALRLLGQPEVFQDFVRKQKTFRLDNNSVSLIRDGKTLKPEQVPAELERLLRVNGGSMEIKELVSKFVQNFNVRLESMIDEDPEDFLARDPDRFTVSEGNVVSLTTTSAVAGKSGTPALGIDGPGKIGLANELEDALGEADSQQYMELHNKICSRAFNSRVQQALNGIMQAVSEAVFLNIDRAVKGGSVGKGTAINGLNDAQVVFFVHGLPQSGHDRWLPPLLRAVAGVLTERLEGMRGVEAIHATEDAVHVCVKGLLSVELRLSPVFNTYVQAVQLLGEQGPEARRFYSPSLVDQRTQFIARQPSCVKNTIRLMKWWRDQQEWSSKLVRPTDEILELVTVYSAVQTKPTDQRQAIANILTLMTRFDELRVVWSNYYNKGDVWAPLLRQRPLLMDPVNPFVNVADPQAFDARELVVTASTTRFFW